MNRFTKIGIQRELNLAWFDQAVRFHAMGFGKEESRPAIYDYLETASGFSSPPSSQTKIYIANVLIKCWISPDSELQPFRDRAFELISANQGDSLPVHWCLLGSAYPFWYKVASVLGRLFRLQKQVTQSQVVTRLREQLGDRESVIRRARYVIRSMVRWGVINDAEVTGCYRKCDSMIIQNCDLATWILESAVLANQNGQVYLDQVLSDPAFFPFRLPTITGDMWHRFSNQVDVVRHGMDHELLVLKPV